MKRTALAAMALMLASSCGSYIVGGQKAPELMPFTIGFTRETCDIVVCGGTMIAPQWVLTAAHCSINGGTIAAIGSGAAPLCNNEYAIASVFPHPDYDGGNNNDIALVSLTTPVCGTTGVPLRNLAGTTVTMAGRGQNVALTLTAAPLSVTPCPHDLQKTTLLCAAPAAGGEHHVAPGDSGGPVLVPNGSSWSLVGVIADEEDPYSAFTPVEPYLDWIHQTMQNNPQKGTCP